MTRGETVKARGRIERGSTRCTPHGAAVGPNAYTREKFATETIAGSGCAPVYAEHDWHELCSGADRKGLRINGRRGRRETRGRPIWDWNITARPNMYGDHGEIYMPASIRVHTRAHKRAALKCTLNVVGRLQWRRRARNGVPWGPNEARNYCERSGNRSTLKNCKLFSQTKRNGCLDLRG